MTVWLAIFCCASGVVIYVTVVYPAICALAGLLPARHTALGELPTVSLVIPAYNEEWVLDQKLQNSLAIEYPGDRLEVIVASDGSVDGTNAIARRWADRGVRLLDFTERRGKASVVNDAVAAAGGEVVCLCDANVMFRPDALKQMVCRLADPRVGAATGDVRLASDESSFGAGERLYYLMERAMQVGESRIGSLMGVDGGMYVLRKSLFHPLPKDAILDDFLVAMSILRQGFRVVYEPRAVAAENGTPLAGQEFRRRVRVTHGAVRSVMQGGLPNFRQPIAWWQYFSHKALRWLMPVWSLAMLLSTAALATVFRGFQILLLFELTICGIALIAAALPAARRFAPVAAVFYFALSQLAMLIGLAKGFRGNRRATWTPTPRTASQTT